MFYGAVLAGAVHPLFDTRSPLSMPFPSNQFTVRDQLQQTRRRIALPSPNCTNSPSDCEDIRVLNALDGFSLQPRLSIPFDGPIDITSVNSATVFVVPTDS